MFQEQWTCSAAVLWLMHYCHEYCMIQPLASSNFMLMTMSGPDVLSDADWQLSLLQQQPAYSGDE